LLRDIETRWVLQTPKNSHKSEALIRASTQALAVSEGLRHTYSEQAASSLHNDLQHHPSSIRAAATTLDV